PGPDRGAAGRRMGFASGPSGSAHEASVAARSICPTLLSAREMMQLGFARSAWSWNSSWVQSRHICLGVEIDLLDRRRTANDAQVDPSGRVDGGGWMSGVAESEAERHREAGGVRGGEQLLRIGSFAVLEPGQDTSEPGPARVGAGPCALTNGQLTRARLQVACPLSTAIAGRHGSPPVLLVSVLTPGTRARARIHRDR